MAISWCRFPRNRCGICRYHQPYISIEVDPEDASVPFDCFGHLCIGLDMSQAMQYVHLSNCDYSHIWNKISGYILIFCDDLDERCAVCITSVKMRYIYIDIGVYLSSHFIRRHRREIVWYVELRDTLVLVLTVNMIAGVSCKQIYVSSRDCHAGNRGDKKGTCKPLLC